MKRYYFNTFSIINTSIFVQPSEIPKEASLTMNLSSTYKCRHFLAAATERQKSMLKYDEIGILVILYKHGAQLSYMKL